MGTGAGNASWMCRKGHQHCAPKVCDPPDSCAQAPRRYSRDLPPARRSPTRRLPASPGMKPILWAPPPCTSQTPEPTPQIARAKMSHGFKVPCVGLIACVEGKSMARGLRAGGGGGQSGTPATFSMLQKLLYFINFYIFSIYHFRATWFVFLSTLALLGSLVHLHFM